MIVSIAVGPSDALGTPAALRMVAAAPEHSSSGMPGARQLKRLRGGADNGEAQIEEDSMGIENDAQILEEIVKDGSKTAVKFEWPAKNGVNDVEICGSWNNWDGQTRLERDGKVFSTIINLVPGKHSYKFVINGETWALMDGGATERDIAGNANNVIYVKPCAEVVSASCMSRGLGRMVGRIVAGAVSFGAMAFALVAGVYELKANFPNMVPVDLPDLPMFKNVATNGKGKGKKGPW